MLIIYTPQLLWSFLQPLLRYRKKKSLYFIVMELDNGKQIPKVYEKSVQLAVWREQSASQAVEIAVDGRERLIWNLLLGLEESHGTPCEQRYGPGNYPSDPQEG